MRLKNVVILVLVLALTGCSLYKDDGAFSNEDDLMKKADNYFDEEEYYDALQLYERFVMNFPGSRFVSKAYYQIGQCNLLNEEYLTAVGDFELFIQNYPSSSMVGEAAFHIGLAYYEISLPAQQDQKYTQKAIEAFNHYLSFYASSPKLIEKAKEYLNLCSIKLQEKDFMNGYVYYKIKEYEAAIVYFDTVIDNYSVLSEWVVKCMLYKGMCYQDMELYKKAGSIYNNIITNYSETYPKVAEVAQDMLSELSE